MHVVLLRLCLCQFRKQEETQLFIYKHDPWTLEEENTTFLGNAAKL